MLPALHVSAAILCAGPSSTAWSLELNIPRVDPQPAFSLSEQSHVCSVSVTPRWEDRWAPPLVHGAACGPGVRSLRDGLYFSMVSVSLPGAHVLSHSWALTLVRAHSRALPPSLSLCLSLKSINKKKIFKGPGWVAQ